MTETLPLPQDPPVDPLLQLQVWLLRSYRFLLCAYRAQLLPHTPEESDHHLPDLSKLLPFKIPCENAPSFTTQTQQTVDSPDTEDKSENRLGQFSVSGLSLLLVPFVWRME